MMIAWAIILLLCWFCWLPEIHAFLKKLDERIRKKIKDIEEDRE